MEEIYTSEELEQQQPRPKFLKVISILSFSSLFMSFIGVISQFVNGPASNEQMLDQKAELLKLIPQMEELNSDYMVMAIKKVVAMSESLNYHFSSVSIVTLISVLIGFYGVLKMWQGKKIGFHFYIIYSLIGVGQIYLFVSPSNIPSFIILWNLIIAGIFTFMYSKNLKWMK